MTKAASDVSFPLPVRAAAPPSDPSSLGQSGPWFAVTVLAGLTLVEGLREGGFWRSDATVVALIAALFLVTTFAGHRLPDRRSREFAMSLVALATWWLARAAFAGAATTFFPLGASLLGFAATFVTVRALGARQQNIAAYALLGIGSLLALIGFAGLIWRWYPLAMPAQGLWRLSTTLTYSDAAGLALAVVTLVALGIEPSTWLNRASVCLCMGGLVASQSRGALIAFACALAFVPIGRYRRFFVPLIGGVVLGVSAAATSTSPHPVLWLAPLLICSVALAVAWKWEPTWQPTGGVRWTKRTISAGVLAAIALATSAFVLRHEISLRAFAPSDRDRSAEWSAAIHQFVSSPWFGVGPDRLLQFVASDGTYAFFAHNEYLQFLADGGLIAAALLITAGLSLVRAIHRTDMLTTCATGALVCWAVGGAFDFDWHVPFMGLLGGCVAGLTARRNDETQQ